MYAGRRRTNNNPSRLTNFRILATTQKKILEFQEIIESNYSGNNISTKENVNLFGKKQP